MSQPIACFLRGTRVLTTKGETPVDQIAIGDLVVTQRGSHLPVKWIGRRIFKKASGSSWPKEFMPIRVSRNAIDGRTPHTDLYLSPNHSLFIDGVLIPANHLVNGVSIALAVPEQMQEIEYFHIELETHEVIFAEGATVESLLVTTDRDIFDNFVEYERLYGGDKHSAMTPCAPIVGYNGRRSELIAWLRRAASPIVDIRDPVQVAFDRTRARARQVIT